MVYVDDVSIVADTPQQMNERIELVLKALISVCTSSPPRIFRMPSPPELPQGVKAFHQLIYLNGQYGVFTLAPT